MVDIRYFNSSLEKFIQNGDYTDLLFLYNASGFAEDTSFDETFELKNAAAAFLSGAPRFYTERFSIRTVTSQVSFPCRRNYISGNALAIYDHFLFDTFLYMIPDSLQ